MNLQTATPEQCDRELYRLMEVRDRQINADLVPLVNDIHRLVGDRRRRVGRAEVWGMTDQGAVDLLDAEVPTQAEAIANLRKVQAQIMVTSDAIKEIHHEWIARGRWNRCYVVTSSDGHVHRTYGGIEGPRCSTCFPSTTFAILFELSGKTDAEIIEKIGSDACTVCYRNAPVYDERRPRTVFAACEQRTVAEREEREAARSARRQDAQSKAITNPDGTPLKGYHGTIATAHTAWIEAVDALSWTIMFRLQGSTNTRDEHLTAAARIVIALADKLGITPEEVLVPAEPADKDAAKRTIKYKATAKLKRDAKEAESMWHGPTEWAPNPPATADARLALLDEELDAIRAIIGQVVAAA